MTNKNRLKDFEKQGIRLNFTNKINQPCSICGMLTFVSKDSIVVMDCYKKEHIVKRDRIKDFEPIVYKRKVRNS